MKKLLGLMMVLAFVANAGIIGGPKGGKLLVKGDVRAEFFVNNDRRIEISFYDENLTAVPVGEQTVSILVSSSEGRSVLELDQTDSGFTSKEPLPEGDGHQIVVRIKQTPDSKFANFRVDYISSVCGGCDRVEYACTCDHAAEEEGDHAH